MVSFLEKLHIYINIILIFYETKHLNLYKYINTYTIAPKYSTTSYYRNALTNTLRNHVFSQAPAEGHTWDVRRRVVCIVRKFCYQTI